MKKIPVKRVDEIFSKCIRERDDWRCQKCGHKPESKQGLDCSHIYGRAKYSVRWHPLNAKALCVGCHRQWHSHPIESTKWIQSYLGEQKYQELQALKNQLVRFRDKDKKEMIAHFKHELAKMESLRQLGKTGRLEFESWNMMK